MQYCLDTPYWRIFEYIHIRIKANNYEKKIPCFIRDFTIPTLKGKLTLVIGASTNPWRYSHMCILKLVDHQIPVIALGLRIGSIGDVSIKTGYPSFRNIHTVSLYIGAKKQEDYSDYILSLHPKRIIFNPETYNPELERLARFSGIKTVEACSLLLIESGLF